MADFKSELRKDKTLRSVNMKQFGTKWNQFLHGRASGFSFVICGVFGWLSLRFACTARLEE